MLLSLLSFKILLLLVSCTGYHLYFARCWQWSIEVLPLTTCAAIISILYLAYFAGLLKVTALSLFGIGLILIGYEISNAIYRQSPLLARLTPGYIFYTALLIFCWYKVQGAYFHGSDEFSHWGLFSKYLYLTDSFMTADSPLQFKDYPPAGALFHYYFYQQTDYAEGVAYFAHDMLIISALAAVTHDSNWRQWPQALFKLLLVLIIYFNFSPGLVSIFIDSTVGTLFGIAIVSYLLAEKDWRVILQVMPVLFILPLLKSVGLLLAIIAGLVIALNQLIILKGQNKQKLSSYLILVALLLMPIIASKSWGYYLQQQGIIKTFATTFSAQKIAASFSASATPRDVKTLASFTHACLTARIDKGLRYNNIGLGSVCFWSLLLISLAVTITICNRRQRQEIICTSMVMVPGSWLYLFGLLLLYLYSYSEYEGTRVAAFERYLAIYFLGWALVTAAFFLKSLMNQALCRRLKTALMLFIIFNTGGIIYSVIFIFKSYAEYEPFRGYTQALAKQIQQQIKPTETVYVIWQHDPGTKKLSINYELLPRHINNTCWSVQRSPHPTEVWTCTLSPHELLERIAQYDYLLLTETDNQFWAEYGAVLPGVENNKWTLLKIKKQNNNIMFSLIESR